MIIYNVTVNVDDSIHDEWLKWMKEVHIPDVMKTGMFKEYRLCKVLSDEDSGRTYSFQYVCDNMDMFEKYRNEFSPALRKQVTEKFGDKFVAFRTLLEVIE
ncbi:MAG TPA: DUF4286 family protein [Bacteroidia bacterium]|nr:DUF4286 family protein [Bacteroidia bacterium]